MSDAAGAPPAATPRLVELLTVVQRRVARSAEDALARVDLTVDQWRALRTLAAGPGLTMGELTERLLIPAPSTTRLVDGLVDRALVYRRSSPGDRRRVEATLTDAGDRLLARAEALVDSHEAEIRSGYGASVVDALLDALSPARTSGLHL